MNPHGVLVDTSVWVDHLRGRSAVLRHLLDRDEVVVHPDVIGELACGHLKSRHETMTLLRKLPGCVVATRDEAIQLLESRRLYGTGLGWIDMQLLASALLSRCRLWSSDKVLADAARNAGVGFEPLVAL